jgi:hypothetical protein
MEKSPRTEALRAEYLELMKTWYDTCLAGIDRAKAQFVGLNAGGIVINSAIMGAVMFLEGDAQVAMLLIAVALSVWWIRSDMVENAKHKEAMRVYDEIGKRRSSIEHEYLALTDTELRGTFTAAEIHRAFDPLLKKYRPKNSSQLIMSQDR